MSIRRLLRPQKVGSQRVHRLSPEPFRLPSLDCRPSPRHPDTCGHSLRALSRRLHGSQPVRTSEHD